jgi:NTE family protein
LVALVPSRIGLVLGAGGVAGGAFHAGVLAALAEVTGWDPGTADVIVGTSAGSVAATSLRAGLAPRDMLARATDGPLSAEGRRLLQKVGPPGRPPQLRPASRPGPPAQLAAILARAASRPFSARPWALMAGLIPEGAVSTEMISTGIGGLFDVEWPTAPLWICAVRQGDGKRVVFGRDATPPVPAAVAASCAIPGFFTPVIIDGGAYVDGGVHSPTNADLLADKDLGLDLVIVSSPMSRTGRGFRLSADEPVRRWSRLLLDGEAVRLRRRGVAVIAFQPTAEDVAVMGVNAMDASRRAAIARQAYESACRRLARPDTKSRLAALAS